MITWYWEVRVSNRHVTFKFASNCSQARQTDRQKVEMSKCLPGRRELFFLGIKNNIVKPF